MESGSEAVSSSANGFIMVQWRRNYSPGSSFNGLNVYYVQGDVSQLTDQNLEPYSTPDPNDSSGTTPFSLRHLFSDTNNQWNGGVWNLMCWHITPYSFKLDLNFNTAVHLYVSRFPGLIKFPSSGFGVWSWSFSSNSVVFHVADKESYWQQHTVDTMTDTDHWNIVQYGYDHSITNGLGGNNQPHTDITQASRKRTSIDLITATHLGDVQFIVRDILPTSGATNHFQNNINAALTLDVTFSITMWRNPNDFYAVAEYDSVGAIIGATQSKLSLIDLDSDNEYYMLHWGADVSDVYVGGRPISLYHIKGDVHQCRYPYIDNGRHFLAPFDIRSSASCKATRLWLHEGLPFAQDDRTYTIRIIAAPTAISIFIDGTRLGVVDTTGTPYGGIIEPGFATWSYIDSTRLLSFGDFTFNSVTTDTLINEAGIVYDTPRQLHQICDNDNNPCATGLACDTSDGIHVCRRDLLATCSDTPQCNQADQLECYQGKCRRKLLASCNPASITDDCGTDLSCHRSDSKCYTYPRKYEQPCSLEYADEVCGDYTQSAAVNAANAANAANADNPTSPTFWICKANTTCACNADAGFVADEPNVLCGSCANDQQCRALPQYQGTCVAGQCICGDGFVKDWYGRCTAPWQTTDCVHGTIADFDGISKCVCDASFTFSGLLGGCRQCQQDYVPGSPGPQVADGTCKEPVICKMSNLIAGCDVISDENESVVLAADSQFRTMQLYSDVYSSSRTVRDQLVRETLVQVVHIVGEMTIEIHLENDDDLALPLETAVNTTIIVYGDEASSNSIKWRLPLLKQVRELRFVNSWVARLPGDTFPVLNTVDTLTFDSNPRLITVYLPLLVSASNSLTVRNNPNLEGLLLPQLQSVDQLTILASSSSKLSMTPFSATVSSIKSFVVSLATGTPSSLDINAQVKQIIPAASALDSLEIRDSDMKSATLTIASSTTQTQAQTPPSTSMFDTLSSFAVVNCPMLEWISVPAASSTSAESGLALRLESNANLKLVYDESALPDSSIDAVSNASYASITIDASPALKHIATCSATNALNILVPSNVPHICCESLTTLTQPINSSLHLEWMPTHDINANCNPDCDLIVTCNADTHKFNPIECDVVTPPIGPLQCSRYVPPVDLVFTAENPLDQEATQFLAGIEYIPQASLIIRSQTDTRTLQLPRLQSIGGSIVFESNMYSHLAIPALSTTSSASTSLTVYGNTKLTTLSLPLLCSGNNLNITNNAVLAFSASSICAAGSITWDGQVTFVDNPLALGSLSLLDEFMARLSTSAKASLTLQGNGGCIVPEPVCRALSTQSILTVDPAFVQVDDNLKFFSVVRGIRAAGMSFTGLVHLPKLPLLQQVVGGDLELTGGIVLTAGFMPALTTVQGTVKITNNPGLESFRFAFKSLSKADGVTVSNNPLLNDALSGFSSLRTLAGKLQIINNAALASVQGLFSLSPSAADGPFLTEARIENCASLQTLHGVEHIVLSQQGTLVIQNNAQLSDISQLSVNNGGTVSVLSNPKLEDLSSLQSRKHTPSNVAGNGACLFFEPGCRVYQGETPLSTITLPNANVSASDVSSLVRIEADVMFDHAPYSLPALQTVHGNVVMLANSTIATVFPALRHIIGNFFAKVPNPDTQLASFLRSADNVDGALVTEGAAIFNDTSVYGTTIPITASFVSFMQQNVFNTVTRVYCSIMFDAAQGSFDLPSAPNLRTIHGSVHIVNEFDDSHLTLASEAAPSLLQTINNITGNLILSNTNLTVLPSMTQVARIGGSFALVSNTRLTTTANSFGKWILGGDLFVRNNPKLKDVDCFAQLQPDPLRLSEFYNTSESGSDPQHLLSLHDIITKATIGGRVVIQGNNVLSHVDALASIANVADDIIVRDNAMLTDWSGLEQALRTQAVRGINVTSVQISNNADCITPMPGCSVFHGDLVMTLKDYVSSSQNYGTMPLPSFWALVEEVNGSVSITGNSNHNASAHSMPSAPVLASIAGSLSFHECSNNAECFAAFGQVPLFIGSHLSVTNSPTSSIRGLARIQSIGGDLILNGLSELFSLIPLSELATIDGNVHVSRCDQLPTLAWFSSLTRVSGSLTVQDNAKLANIALNPDTTVNTAIIAGSISAVGGLSCTQVLVPESYSGNHDNSTVPCTVYQGADIIVSTVAMSTAPFWSTIQRIEASVTFQGTITLPATPALTDITGSLILTGNRLVSSNAFGAQLQHVGRDVIISKTVDFYHMPGSGFSSLVEIGGALAVVQNANLDDFIMRSLVSIGGMLQFDSNAALVSLDGLSTLRVIGGALNIQNNEQLFDLKGIESVTDFGRGDIIIARNAVLQNLKHIPAATAAIMLPEGFEATGIIAGSIYIFENPHLQSLSGGLNTVRHIDGHFAIGNNPSLTSLSGSFDSLAVVAGFVTIKRMAQLQSLAGLHALTRIGNKLDVTENANLQSLDGLQAISAIGSYDSDTGLPLQVMLDIRDNPKLSDISAFVRLQDSGSQVIVKGHVVLRNNVQLDSLFGLFSKVARESSSSLPSAAAATTATTVPMVVEGSIVVSDNAVCRSPEPNCVKYEHDTLRYDAASASAHASFWDAVELITGELEVSVATLNSASVPNLVQVGALTLTNGVSSCVGAFASLETVQSNLVVASNPSLSAIDTTSFPKLTHIGGTIRIQDNAALSDASGILNRLIALDQQPELHVQGNAFECYSILEHPQCQLYIGVGDVPLRIDSSEVSEQIWSHIIHMEGPISLESLSVPPTAFTAPTAPKLLSMRGSLTVGAGVTSLSGLSALEQVQGITVLATAQLPHLGGLTSLKTVRGTLRVAAGTSMQSLFGGSAYSGCTSITEDLEFDGDSASASFTVLQVSQLAHIGGSLIVRNAAALTSVQLPALHQLDTIDFHNLATLQTIDLGSLNVLSGSLRVSACNTLTNLNWASSVLSSELQGSLSVENNSQLASLSALSVVTSVAGKLKIVADNSNFQGLGGLENIVSVTGGVHLQGSAITELATLTKLSSIGGSITITSTSCQQFDESFAPELSGDAIELIVSNNDFLQSFTSNNSRAMVSPSITVRDGSPVKLLQIESNPALQTLQGLGGFTHVVNLVIRQNNALETLDGLQKLVHIDVLATVQDNANLVHLEALLQNFDTTSFVGLVFDGNKPCTRPIVGCEVYAGSNALIVELSVTPAVPESDDINNSTESDTYTDLETNGADGSLVPKGFWSNIRVIETSLTFEGPHSEAGVNLPSAPRLERVGGSLTLRNGILDMSGIGQLKEIGGDLEISSNDQLVTLGGLVNVTSIGGAVRIEDNSVLQSTDPISPQSIGGSVTINANPVMSTFAPLLDSIEQGPGAINGDIVISNNAALTTLNGLANVRSIKGVFQVSNNPTLPDLSGCDSIEAISSGTLRLVENTNLNVVDDFNWAIVSERIANVDLTFSDNAACLMPQSGCRTLLPRAGGDNTLAFDDDSADFASVGLAYTLRRRISPRQVSAFPSQHNVWTCPVQAQREVAEQRVMCMNDCPLDYEPIVDNGDPSCMAPCIAPAVLSKTDSRICVEYATLKVSHATTDKAEFWASVQTIRMNIRVPDSYTGQFIAPSLTTIEGDLIIDQGLNLYLNSSMLDDTNWAMFPELTRITGRLHISGQDGGFINLKHIAPKLSSIGALELIDNTVDTNTPVDLSQLSQSISLASLVIRDTNVSSLFQVKPSASGGSLETLHISGAPALTSLVPLSAVTSVTRTFVIASTGVSSLAPLNSAATQIGAHQVVIHDNPDLVDLANVLDAMPLQNLLSSWVYGGPATCTAPTSTCQVLNAVLSGSFAVDANLAAHKAFAQNARMMSRAVLRINCGGPAILASERDLFIGDTDTDDLGSIFSPRTPPAIGASKSITIAESSDLDAAFDRQDAIMKQRRDIFKTARESFEPITYVVPVIPLVGYRVCVLVAETEPSVVQTGQRAFVMNVSTDLTTRDNDEQWAIDTYGLTGERNDPREACLPQSIDATSPWLRIHFETAATATKPIRIMGITVTARSMVDTSIPAPTMFVESIPKAPVFEHLRLMDYNLEFTIAKNGDSNGAHGPQFPKLQQIDALTVLEQCGNVLAPIFDFDALLHASSITYFGFPRGKFSILNALITVNGDVKLMFADTSDASTTATQRTAMIEQAATDITGFQALRTIGGDLKLTTSAQCSTSYAFPKLESVNGFSSLTSITGVLAINGVADAQLSVLTFIDGLRHVESVRGIEGTGLPSISWQGLQGLHTITSASDTSFDSTTAKQRMFGFGALTTSATPGAFTLTGASPVPLACSNGWEGQPHWELGSPKADGSGVQYRFRDRSNAESGYLFAVQKRGFLLGGTTPQRSIAGCSSNAVAVDFSWIDVSNAIGRDVHAGENLKFMVYAVGESPVLVDSIAVQETVVGLEAAAFVRVPYFGLVSASVTVATPSTTIPSADSVSASISSGSTTDVASVPASSSGGVPGAYIRTCWSVSLDASDCTPIATSFSRATDASGKVEIPPSHFFFDVSSLTSEQHEVYIFSKAYMPNGRLLHCASAGDANAVVPTHVCVSVLDLRTELNPTSPDVIKVAFEDPDSVSLQGRILLRGTRSHTKSGNSCPCFDASLEITGPLAANNDIKSSTDIQGNFMLTIVGGGSTAASGEYVSGRMFVSLASHKFGLADFADTTGEAVRKLSRDNFVSYFPATSKYGDKALLFRLLPSQPGREDVLALEFRMHVSVRGNVPLNFVDITPPRVVTINAQQGLCTARRRALSSSRPTALMFVGGTDATSWCPDFEYRYQLQPSRVVANIPMPALPVVVYVASAPTAPQQAYFDFMGTQALSLHDAASAPYATNWIYRSKPRIEVKMTDNAGSSINGPPAGCIASGVLDDTQSLHVIPPRKEADKFNLQLEVHVNEYYDDVACAVVPGLFSMISALDIADADAAATTTTTTAATTTAAAAAAAAKPLDCIHYISKGEVVPGAAPCTRVLVTDPWPLKVKLRATRPASASPSNTDPLDFVWPTGVDISFQAIDAKLVSSPAGLSAVAVKPAQRTPRQTAVWQMKNVLVQGKYTLSKFFSVLLPRKHPLLFLYKPPGDLSYSELTKGTVLKVSYSASSSSQLGQRVQFEDRAGGGIKASICTGVGFAKCLQDVKSGTTVGAFLENESNTGTETTGGFVAETELVDTIRTGSVFPEQDTTTYDTRFVPGNGDLDMFVGLGTTTVYEKNRIVLFDESSCKVSVTDDVKLEDIAADSNTLEVQQIYDIKYRILPELEGMVKNQLVTGTKLTEIKAAVADWKAVLAAHKKRRDTLFAEASASSTSTSDTSGTVTRVNFWKGAFGRELLKAMRIAQAYHYLPPYINSLTPTFSSGAPVPLVLQNVYKGGGSTSAAYAAAAYPVQTVLSTMLQNRGRASVDGAPSVDDVNLAAKALSDVNMISFSGGGHQYEHEYKSSTTSQHQNGYLSEGEFSAGVAIESDTLAIGFENYLQSHTGVGRVFHTDAHLVREEEHPLTVKFGLGDDDLGDYYDVRIHEDPRTGVPLFQTVSGRSSCPNAWQTVPRERIEVLRRKFVLEDVDPNQSVSIKVPIVNSSPTDEMFPYSIVQNATTNQKGLKMRMFGQSVTEEFIPVYLLPQEITNVEFEITRPDREAPEYYDFEDVTIVVVSPCNWHQVWTDFSITIHYMKPCPKIEWVGAMADDWTNVRAGIDEVSIATSLSGMLVVPEDGIPLAVRNPHWQLASWSSALQLEAVEVQARKVGTQQWITVSDNLKNNPETNWGEVIVKNTWPNQAPNPSVFTDGIYELRGITKCQKAAGIRSDSLKYSVTEVKRVILGNRHDPLEALKDDITQRVDASLATIRNDVNASRVEVDKTLASMQHLLQASHHTIESKVNATLDIIRSDINSSQSVHGLTLSTLRYQLQSHMDAIQQGDRAHLDQSLDMLKTTITAAHAVLDTNVNMSRVQLSAAAADTLQAVRTVEAALDAFESGASTSHANLRSDISSVANSLNTLSSDVGTVHTAIRNDVNMSRVQLSAAAADTLQAVRTVEAALDAFESGASTSHADLRSDISSVASSLNTLSSDVDTMHAAIRSDVNMSHVLLSASIKQQLAVLSKRLNYIITNNTHLMCGLDSDVSTLNATLDSLTSGSCSLQETESDSIPSSSSAAPSPLLEAVSHSSRQVVCDASHSLSCCGNGILEPGEGCDTSTTSASCVKCVVAAGWACQGALGVSSVCTQVVPDEPVKVTFGDGSTSPSVSLPSEDGTVINADFPADMLPAGAYVNVSLPTPVHQKSGKVLKGTYLRIDASETPNFSTTPLVVVIRLEQDASGKCTQGDMNRKRLRLYDVDTERWTDAARTCSRSLYRREADASTCTLTTHVCHLTDFGVFDEEVSDDDSTWTIAGINGIVFVSVISVVGILLIVLAIVLLRRRRSAASKRIEARLQWLEMSNTSDDIVCLNTLPVASSDNGAIQDTPVLEDLSQGPDHSNNDTHVGESSMLTTAVESGSRPSSASMETYADQNLV
jgi:hypothetical protein